MRRKNQSRRGKNPQQRRKGRREDKMRGSKAGGGGRGPPKGHNFVLTERRETRDEKKETDRVREASKRIGRKVSHKKRMSENLNGGDRQDGR